MSQLTRRMHINRASVRVTLGPTSANSGNWNGLPIARDTHIMYDYSEEFIFGRQNAYYEVGYTRLAHSGYVLNKYI